MSYAHPWSLIPCALAAFVLALPPRPGAPQEAPASASRCTVARIVDGDTFDCDVPGTPSGWRVRVRLLAIDAPEMGQAPYGAQAKAALARLLPLQQPVRLEVDVRAVDRYGRLLAYVWRAGEPMVNAAMLRSGYASLAVQPPNVRHAEALRAAARDGRAANAGLWAGWGFACEAGAYRRGRCR